MLARHNLFSGMSVTRALDQWVERQPDKTAVLWAPFEDEDWRWSYAELAVGARRFAAGLRARGAGVLGMMAIEPGCRRLIFI